MDRIYKISEIHGIGGIYEKWTGYKKYKIYIKFLL
jgi:hypothetical protein